MTAGPDPELTARTPDGSPSLDDLIARARGLVPAGRRAILGIAGPPGSGKSYLAERLVYELQQFPPDHAVQGRWVCNVPMDGFHLADNQLCRLDRADRKGAPDTFDAHGLQALMRRILDDRDHTIYAPAFDRSLDQPIAGSIAIDPAVRLVVIEGNYLLADFAPWADLRPLMAEVWYSSADEQRRVAQLRRRHVQFGKSFDDAQSWVERSDQPNAEIVAGTRHRADLIIPEATLSKLEAAPGAAAGSAHLSPDRGH